MATIELNDDTLYTSALPAGARVFGATSAAASEPTSFGREAFYNYISAALSPVASSGSATDLTTGTLPLGRLHAWLADIASIAAPNTNDVLYFNGTDFVSGPGTTIAVGGLAAANNLSDVASAATARTNIGLAIGTHVQAYNARLADIAGASWAQGDVMYYNGSNLVRLPAGTSGHFLKTLGAGANPEWAASSGAVATDAIWDAKGDLAVGTGANTASVLGVGSNGQVLSADSGEATGLKWITVAGTGDVTAASSFGTDNVVIRADGTGKGVQSSLVSISDNADLTAYDATNDGNPVIAYGASATERLRIVPTYDTGAQTIDYVLFTTDVASATADKGLFRFSPDAVAVLDIDDGGINLAASMGISIAGTDIITDSAGTATLSNIDAIDATTEATIEAAIDTLANLSSIQGVAFTFGAYAATLLNNANEAAFKAAINAEAGVDFQAYDADLASWAGVTRAAGFDTFATTPSSANLASLVSDETGTGALVFANSPTLVTPALGIPASGTLTNCTGLPQAGTVGLTTADSPQFAGVNLGHSAALASVASDGTAITPKAQTHGTDNAAAVSVSRWSADANPANLVLSKSRGASANTHTVVQSGDEAGAIVFAASDGTDMEPVAAIKGIVNGTPGAGDMPGGLTFSTTADAAEAVTEHMRLNNDGRLSLGTTKSSTSNASTVTPKMFILGTGVNAAGQFVRHTSPGAGGPQFIMSSTRGTDIDDYTTVQSGDGLGTFGFYGTDGDQFCTGAVIQAVADGAVSNNTLPTRVSISTNQGGGNNTTVEAFRIDSTGAVYFPDITTTASAANAFLDSGSSPANNLLRSTSSLRYKTDVETLDPVHAAKILDARPVWYRSTAANDRKDWSHYGLIAEELAEIEPRLVHYAYKPEDWEDVVSENGITRRVKDGAQKVPDGVAYDRITVLLLSLVQKQAAQIAAMEARLAALEAQ